MQGQWIGEGTGDALGQIVLNVDRERGVSLGTACLFPRDLTLPGTIAFLRNVVEGQDLVCDVAPLHPTGRILSEIELNHSYPDVTHDQKANIKLIRNGTSLSATYKTDSLSGSAKLELQAGDAPSVITADTAVTDWKSFKEHLTKGCQYDCVDLIFRGQPCSSRLRTSFHRTNRSDLWRYVLEDIPSLHRFLSPSLKHFFDLNNPLEVGAFYNLVQHHGYPTPLLDWTFSPYIAAFFAFSDADQKSGGKVRLFQFKKREWQSSLQQVHYVHNVRPHFSVIELLGIENPRMLPQQAVSSLTNVSDIEAYVQAKEKECGKQFISAFEFSVDQREQALLDLNRMGINASTMFPSVDTTCKFMKSQRFEVTAST